MQYSNLQTIGAWPLIQTNVLYIPSSRALFLDTFSRSNLNGHNIPTVDSHKNLGVTVDSTLCFHLHVTSVVNKAAGLSANLLNSTMYRSKEYMLSLLKSHVRPLLEYSCLWNIGYISNVKPLESGQRTWTHQIEGLSALPYAECLKTLNPQRLVAMSWHDQMLEDLPWWLPYLSYWHICFSLIYNLNSGLQIQTWPYILFYWS